MSSGCGDVLSLQDLQVAKRNQIFEAEVITGKQGGIALGANIDYATNQNTGQVQKTMPAILRDIGFEPASFDFTSGGTLTTNDRNKAVLWPMADGGDGDWYYWEGALPKVIPAASTPASTGGIAEGAWRPVGDITLRGDLADGSDVDLGDALLAVRVPFTGGVVRTQHDKNLERVSVKDFGAKGDYVTDDTAAIIAADAAATAAGGMLYFPRGVYKCSNGVERKSHWCGDFAPQLAPFPITGDAKQYLRPGYKHLLPGSLLLFTGTGSNTATTQRTDAFASFTYCVKDETTGLQMRDIAIVLDCDIYDAAGNLTAYGAENSAVYSVGHYINDAAQCLREDTVVFGYFPLAGTAIRSVAGMDDPDYNIFRGGSTMGRYGLALIGSDSNDGFDSGLSGTMSFGMDIFTLDHHARSEATAAAIYANANTWACVYIDGYTDAVQADINGHYFYGGSIRTYAIHPISLNYASQANFIGCIFESSNFASSPNAATKQWVATANTQDVGITNCRFSTDVGLLSSNFGGVMKGQLTIVNCPGLAAGGGVIVSEANSGQANWVKLGGASGGTGDPAIQFGQGSALSSNTGWNIRRDIDVADVLDVRWNGASVHTLYTGGGFGRSGYAVGPTRTIAAGVITISTHSYYRVANEGAAATDDLDTINGGSFDGQLLILAAASSTQDVVLKDMTGNLRLVSDFTLTHAQDRIMLQWDGTAWVELSRADNTA